MYLHTNLVRSICMHCKNLLFLSKMTIFILNLWYKVYKSDGIKVSTLEWDEKRWFNTWRYSFLTLSEHTNYPRFVIIYI